MFKPRNQGETIIRAPESDAYPEALARALRSLFTGLPEVDAAYIALCSVPHSGDRPHHVIGIEGAGELDAAMQAARKIARRHLAAGEFVDFVRIGETRLSRRLVLETEPFYLKQPSVRH